MSVKKQKVNCIICGDTVEELKKLKDNSVDLIFADPPYWLRVTGTLHRINGDAYDGCDDEWDKQFGSHKDYEAFTRNWLTECKRVLKKNGSIWVIGGMQCIYTIGAIMQEMDFWFINDVIWYKKNPTPNFKGTRLNNSHETLIWATKDKKSKYVFHYKTAKELNTDTVAAVEHAKGVRKQMGSVWRMAVCQGEERLKDENGDKLHSTQKPEDLLYRIIVLTSNAGDVVLDPFGGTMTTGAVAKKTGRNYICIDNNPIYCEYGKNRIEKVKPSVSNIETAVYDKKSPKPSLGKMIEDGYFNVNEEFYYGGKPCGNLTDKGKIYLSGFDCETDIHSGIAKIKQVKASRLNGWDYWQVIREGELTDIDDIRKKYIREVLKFE